MESFIDHSSISLVVENAFEGLELTKTLRRRLITRAECLTTTHTMEEIQARVNHWVEKEHLDPEGVINRLAKAAHEVYGERGVRESCRTLRKR